MAFRYNGNDDDQDEQVSQPQPISAPEVPQNVQPLAPEQPRPRPTSAPAVPKGLLSARPAMTRVVPRSPEKMAQLQARQAAAAQQRQQAQQPAQPRPVAATPQEIAERKERIEYLKSLRAKEQAPKRKGGKRWPIVLLVLLVLVGLAGGAYWFLAKPSSEQAADTSASQQPAATNQQPAATTPATTTQSAEMKDYQSTNFAVSLKYPADWKVSDTAQKLTITSPMQNLPSASGSPSSGQVVFMIRPKQSSLEEFKTGNAAAVLDSKTLNYSQPAAGQRGSTYISYVQYPTTTVKGALDAIFVTGNTGYKKGQAIPQADVVKVDPLITVNFLQCAAGGTCSATAPPMSVQASGLTSTDLEKTIEAIIQSLAIS